MRIFQLLLLSLVYSWVSVRAENPETFNGKPEMNGISFSEYKDFAKNWHFVTVRFRRDTNEMRLTYANDQAWETLNRGETDYPDGAVFAKLGVATHEDVSFPSSAVPSGLRRYQLMVRNKKKYPETAGWGYALFDSNGKTFPENPKSSAQACAACHSLVPERGQVFSQLMQDSQFNIRQSEKPSQLKLVFADLKWSDIPAPVRAVLPEGKTSSVRSVQGAMRRHLFQGTLDEVRPALAAEVVRSGKAAVLMSDDGARFAVAFQSSEGKCATNMIAIKGVSSNSMRPEQKYEVHFCQPR